jgi:hypothetical protein
MPQRISSLPRGVSRCGNFSSVTEALDSIPTDLLVDYTNAEVVKGSVLAAV